MAFCAKGRPADGLQETYTIGGKSGWGDLTVKNGVTKGLGRHGLESITLDTAGKKPNRDTDMLLSFEGSLKDVTGNYTIRENTLFTTNEAFMGREAAFSRGFNGGLTLVGKEGTFFSRAGKAGSFVIDFWLKPSLVDNGEILLEWRSSRANNQKIIYQHITFMFNNDSLMCIFSNIFDGYEKNDGDVILQGDERLPPKKWGHHRIAYSEDTGLLTYSLDDTTQDIKFITSNGHENGSVYSAIIGTAAAVSICPHFTGIIDDFSIQTNDSGDPLDATVRDSESRTQNHFVTSGGRIESTPLLLPNKKNNKLKATLNRINATIDTPPQTEIHFFVRSGDNHFSWNDNYPKWHRVESGQELKGISGLYFQVACDFYCDGSGEKTPNLSQIDLVYTPHQEPRAPYKVNIMRGNNSVTLKWTKSVDEDVAGYYIYYGTKSGEYLGNKALEGSSPLNVGDTLSYTLNGLQNGTIYYFAIASYSKIDKKITGDLSKEVFARPCVERY